MECPKCKSKKVTTKRRGYSIGNALCFGLIFGFAGRNNLYCVCQKCGFDWEEKVTKKKLEVI